MAKGKPLTDEEKEKRDAEKAANFVKLAEARTAKALDSIAKLRGLGSANYISTEAQRTKIVQALENGVIKVAQALEGKGPASSGFSLSE